MLEVVRDWHRLTGERIGVKPAGGIRTSKDAIKYLVTVAETAGEEWLTPSLFRFGASSLLNDVLLQRQKITTGHYSGPDYVTVD
jgi:deoxyribose-phosphate aldolase